LPKSLHEARNDNGVRVVNFATLKSLLLRAQHFYTATFINTLGLLLMASCIIRSRLDRQQMTFKYTILDVHSFRGADCDTDHYLVVAKLRERISVSI
jgi:hypothetical protein